MRMKNKLFLGLTSTILLGLGLVGATTNTTNVEATSINVNSNNKLQCKAYIYNGKGKRIYKTVLKPNKNIKIVGIENIHGKLYAKIGSNQYIKLINFFKSESSKKKTAHIKRNSYIYDSLGKRYKGSLLRKGKVVIILGSKIIKNIKYYQIGKNQYVKVNNIIIKGNKTLNENKKLTNNSMVIDNDINQYGSETTYQNSEDLEQTNNSDVENKNMPAESQDTTDKKVKEDNTPTISTIPVDKKDTSSNTNKGKDDKETAGDTENDNNYWDLKKAREESVNTNDVTKEDKLLNTETIDGPYTANAEVLHDGFIYDEDGNHIPGEYISKKAYGNFKPQWTRLGYKIINGHKYYLIQYNKPKKYYVKYDVFAKNGKDENPVPVTSDQLANARDFLDKAEYITKVFDDKYQLAERSIRNNYDASLLALDQLLSQDKYSESDIKAFEDNITEAANKLNGKRIIFHNPITRITKKQKEKIVKLVNKVEGSKDAGFLPGSDYTIVYTSPTFNLQMKENVSKYATFSTEK